MVPNCANCLICSSHISSKNVTLTARTQLATACSKSGIETLEKSEIFSNLTIKTPERRY